MRPLFLIVALLSLSPAAWAASMQKLFEQGNRLYWAGNYDGAIKSYRRIEDLGGVNEDLFYNLGAAYLKEGQTGRAICSFERARRLDPRSPDIQHNLELARAKLADKDKPALEPAGLTDSLLSRFTENEAMVLFLGPYLLFFLILVIHRYLKPSTPKTTLAIVAIALVLVFVGTGVVFGAKVLHARVGRGVVVQRVEMKEGPQGDYQTVLPLAEGLTVELVRDHDRWVRVKLPSGIEGWVPVGTVCSI